MTPPPRLRFSNYSASLTSISVTFDRATSQPTSPNCFDLIRAQAQILDKVEGSLPSLEETIAALGPAIDTHYNIGGISRSFAPTVCEWKNEYTLEISFSAAAKIGDTGVIYPVPGAIPSNVRSIYGSCGQTQPRIPESLAPATVSISAPGILGPCDQLVAVAQVSGTGGRHVLDWSLLPPPSVETSFVWNVEAIRDIEAQSRDVFVVPPTKLPSGDNYSLSVEVYPMIGTATNTTISFDQSLVPVPLLDVGPKSEDHEVQYEYVRKIDVRSPVCAQNNEATGTCPFLMHTVWFFSDVGLMRDSQQM